MLTNNDDARPVYNLHHGTLAQQDDLRNHRTAGHCRDNVRLPTNPVWQSIV